MRYTAGSSAPGASASNTAASASATGLASQIGRKTAGHDSSIASGPPSRCSATRKPKMVPSSTSAVVAATTDDTTITGGSGPVCDPLRASW